MLPFLHDNLLKLVKNVFLLITKSNLVHACSTVTELRKIKLINKDNSLKSKKINLGFGRRKGIIDLKEYDLVSTKDYAILKNDCISFITIIVSKLFDGSPLLSVIVRNANLNIIIWAINFTIKCITRSFIMLNTMIENENTSFLNISINISNKWTGSLNTSWSLMFFHHHTMAKPLSSTLNSFKSLKGWIQMNWDILKRGKQTLMIFT